MAASSRNPGPDPAQSSKRHRRGPPQPVLPPDIMNIVHNYLPLNEAIGMALSDAAEDVVDDDLRDARQQVALKRLLDKRPITVVPREAWECLVSPDPCSHQPECWFLVMQTIRAANKLAQARIGDGHESKQAVAPQLVVVPNTRRSAGAVDHWWGAEPRFARDGTPEMERAVLQAVFSAPNVQLLDSNFTTHFGHQWYLDRYHDFYPPEQPRGLLITQPYFDGPGRGPIDDPPISTVQRIEKLGYPDVYLTADVSQEDMITAVQTAIEARWHRHVTTRLHMVLPKFLIPRPWGIYTHAGWDVASGNGSVHFICYVPRRELAAHHAEWLLERDRWCLRDAADTFMDEKWAAWVDGTPSLVPPDPAASADRQSFAVFLSRLPPYAELKDEPEVLWHHFMALVTAINPPRYHRLWVSFVAHDPRLTPWYVRMGRDVSQFGRPHRGRRVV